MAITMGIGVMVSGCAGKTTRPDASAADPVVVDALSMAAEKIHRNLNLLVKLRQSQVDVSRFQTPRKSTDPRLMTPITLNWVGPLEPAAKILAEISGYRLTVVGRPPNQPRVVTLMAHDEPVIHVVENLGWQAGEKIGVVLNEPMRELRVVYEGT